MTFTSDDVRRIGLSFPEAEEHPHFDKSSLRVRGKIFVTLPTADHFVFKATLSDQAVLTDMFPDVFSLAGWAHQGWTKATYETISTDQLEDVLTKAWRNVAPKTVIKAWQANR